MSTRAGGPAVGFDFGGTLAPKLAPLLYRLWREEFERQIGKAAAQAAHEEFERAQAAYWASPDDRPEPSVRLATDALARTLHGTEVKSHLVASRVDAAVRERFAAEVPVQPGVPELLRWLAEEEIDVGILSNFIFPSGTVKGWLGAHGLDGYVSAVLTSCDIGVAKPSADAFQVLLGSLDLTRADELIYVGNDWREDIKGALAAGCRAIYVTGTDPGGEPDRGRLRVPEVSSLPRIRHLIQSMRLTVSEASWGERWGQWVRGPGREAFHHHRGYLEPILPSAGRVLDAGCGDGRFSEELARAGCLVIGLDRHHELCVAAARRSSLPAFAAGDVHRLPFRDQSFDWVVSIMLLQDLPRALPVLQEFRRVLAVGGGLVLAVSHPFSTTLSRLDSGQLVVSQKYGSGEPYSRIATADGLSIEFNGFQHSMEEYFRSLREAGFRVDYMREVVWPSSSYWSLVPRYLHISAAALLDYFRPQRHVKHGVQVQEVAHSILIAECLAVVAADYDQGLPSEPG